MFDRDEQEISQIIETGIEAILTGRSTLEEVLAEHPMQAEEIRGELEGALWLTSRQQEVEARSGFVSASRKRVIERIKAEASSQGTRRAFFGFAWPQRLAFQWIVAIAVIMSLLTGTGGVLTVSQSSIPGEDLYPIKRAAEDVTYTVTMDNVDKVELSTQFADRRLDEAKALIVKGDYPTAETTLVDYEQGIHRTLYLLEKASDKPTNEVEKAAVTVKQNFAKNVQKLNVISEQLPMNTKVKDHVRKAMTASLDGAMMAGTLYQKIQDDKLAPSIAPTNTSPPPPPPPATPTAVPDTATPVKPTAKPVPPTSTPAPHHRPPNSTATPAPTDTPVPTAAPTDTPLPTQAPTDTPAPTALPTDAPTSVPTDVPTAIPTDISTSAPTAISAAVLPSDTPAPTATPLSPTGIAPQGATPALQFIATLPTP